MDFHGEKQGILFWLADFKGNTPAQEKERAPLGWERTKPYFSPRKLNLLASIGSGRDVEQLIGKKNGMSSQHPPRVVNWYPKWLKQGHMRTNGQPFGECRVELSAGAQPPFPKSSRLRGTKEQLSLGTCP